MSVDYEKLASDVDQQAKGEKQAAGKPEKGDDGGSADSLGAQGEKSKQLQRKDDAPEGGNLGIATEDTRGADVPEYADKRSERREEGKRNNTDSDARNAYQTDYDRREESSNAEKRSSPENGAVEATGDLQGAYASPSEERGVYSPPRKAGTHAEDGSIIEAKDLKQEEEEDSENGEGAEKEEDEQALPKVPEIPEPEEEESAEKPPPLDGPYEYTDSDGHTFSMEYKEGVLDGPFAEVDAEKKPVIEGTFKAGKKDGVWKIYQDGVLQAETSFADDELEGVTKTYSAKDILATETTFAKGEREGSFCSYQADGTTPAVEGTFEKGAISGPLTSYDVHGQVIMTAMYKEGQMNGPMKSFYTDEKPGALLSSAEYVDGRKQGEEHMFYASGAPLSTGKYNNGQPIGKLEIFPDSP